MMDWLIYWAIWMFGFWFYIGRLVGSGGLSDESFYDVFCICTALLVLWPVMAALELCELVTDWVRGEQ